MKVVFCGTPEFAVPTLKHLLSQPEFEIAAVITQPDRPSGRGMKLKFSAVKQAAVAASVPVHQPEKIRAADSRQLLERLAPDVVVIIAYGQIIPASLLPIAKLGWINLHGSLLPKYRGAAPIQWAIANGETRTGLTSMRIDAGMDTGEMLLHEETVILPSETTPQLAARLAEIGAPLMAKSLRGIATGTLVPQPQRHEEATYAPLLKKEDGRIDWNRTASEIYNRMRAFTPWPGAFTSFRGETCHITGELTSMEMTAVRSTTGIAFDPSAPPGTIRITKDAILVTCGGATELRVLSVKLAGGQAIEAGEFASSLRLTEWGRFGDS
jgi:methionyl-tRNA formyltransferase